jgi:hypothetical protein
MTIQELHSNEELRQHEFPVTRKTFFSATPAFVRCRGASPKR